MNTKEMDKLHIFIGSWRTSGTIVSDDGNEPTKLAASDVYEWFPGKSFIVHHVNGSMGDAQVKALEIFRFDEREGLILQSIDNGGRYSEYKAQLHGHSWNIKGSSERFEGKFNDDYTVLEGQWFTLQEGKGDKPWMQIKLKKEPD